MKINLFSTILIISGAMFVSSCSSSPSCLNVVPPKVNLTGEKTVIERQIIGDYQEIEKNAWAISSVKRPSTGTNPKGVRKGDAKLIAAMEIREQHLNEIGEYKKDGALGESNTGYLKYIKVAKYESDRLLKKQLMKIMQEENVARRTIFLRCTLSAGKEDETRAAAFGKTFAKERAALANKNDWIQESSGQWVRK